MEVAEMVEKEHAKLLRDIKRYIGQINEANVGLVDAEAKIGLGDFFRESTYIDAKGETRPCYQITKKGCEFIAHKLTGVKGTAFTAKYINKFHEMEDELQQGRKKRQTNEMPWFIRKFMGKYVILVRDFSAITGVDIKKHKKFFSLDYFIPGMDWNVYWWKGDNEKFKKEYGFDYGNEQYLDYMTMSGAKKALRILEEDKKEKINLEACEYIAKGIEKVSGAGRKEIKAQEKNTKRVERQSKKELPIQVNIYLGSENMGVSCTNATVNK